MRTSQKTRAQMPTQQETLRHDRQRLLTLQSISSRISAISELDELLDEMVKSLITTYGCTNALLFLMAEGEEKLRLAASRHPIASKVIRAHSTTRSEEIVSRVASTGVPLLVSDAHQNDSVTISDPEIRSNLVVPMSIGGRLVGVLCLESDQRDAFEEQDLQLVTVLANHLAAAIEVIRTVRESQANATALEQRAQDLMLVNRISTTLSSSLDAYEILNVTVQHLVELINMDYGGVLMLERDGQHGQVIAEHPTHPLADVRLLLPPLPAARPMLELGIPHPIEDAADHPLLQTIQKQVPSLTFRSLLLVSLVARREFIGILLLASFDQPRSFSDEEMEICQTVASQAAVAVANARLLQHVQQQRHALTRRSQELTEASSKLDAVLNNIADGLVVTDPTGSIILHNPVFRDMIGPSSTRSLYGHLLAELFPVAGLLSLVSQALETPGQVLVENLELADGRVLKVSATALRIPPPILEPEKEEQIAGVVTVLQDITHEVEVDRMKTGFISTVSHELRSPLTAILGFTHLIKRDFGQKVAPHLVADEQVSQTADRILANLSIIQEQGQRLTRLVNDVLDISRIEAGQIEWPMHDVDLVGVIQSAVAAASALAKGNTLPIHVHLPPDGLPLVQGHRDRLVQVITNLLSNSIKFTRQGHIEVSARHLQVTMGETPYPGTLPPGEWVIVSITDTGIGIPAEAIPHLFDKFTQVGDMLTDKPPGTGLGLAISKEIVEHHGGRIWVETEPGVGSTFSFILPAVFPNARGTAASVPKPQSRK